MSNSLSDEAALLLALSHDRTPTQAMAAWCAAYAQGHGVSENAAKGKYLETVIELEGM
jgi:hypothetical protein